MAEVAKPKFHGLYLPFELLMESELAKTTMVLLCDIASFDIYYKSRDKIAKLLKVSVPHVSALLKELKDAGLIEEVGRVFNKKLYSATKTARKFFGAPTEEYNKHNQEIIKQMEEENKQLVQDVHKILGGKKPLRATGKYTKAMKNRRLNFTKEEILQAARNLSQSDFHMGKNINHTKYATVEFLLRSDETIEKWLNERIEDRHKEELIERLIL